MSNWTVDQVGEWLKKTGFEQLIKPFKEKNIDGMDLSNLTDNVIEQIVSMQNNDEEQNTVIIERFKRKLNRWKIQNNTNATRIRQHSISRASASVASAAFDIAPITSNDTDTAYERTLKITPDHPRVDVRFFRNPFFCEKLQLYLSKKFRTTCSIKLEQQEVIFNFIGNKQNVTDSLDAMKSLFQATETKIYSSEPTDRKAIYWSRHIFSSSAIEVIQQIMNNERIFTVWEKTEMFSGYYKVLYFNHELFGASVENITHIFLHEIDYVENLKMPNDKTKNFMKEIEKFIIQNRQAELIIIQHKYPDKLDIKINLFGRKKLVKIVKKNLQLLVNKHTLTKFDIKMTTMQHEHLIDNCFHQLKNLERKYSDDSVLIRIRQKEFYAPQYLIDEIKHQINAYICLTAVFIIQKVGDHAFLTDEHNAQLSRIVKKYGCRIEKIDPKMEVQTFQIPKALAKTLVTSSILIEQSNQFSSLLSVRKFSVSNGSVEIHKANRSMCLTSDVTVISTDAGAAEEHISSSNDNMFVETKSSRKILFIRWSLPTAADIEKQHSKQKRYVVKFLGAVFENITICCPNVTTIAFSTDDWQNFSFDQQLVEEFLVQTKQEMEARKSKWKILFIFNNEQGDLYNKFNKAMKHLQSNEDGFAQYSCSIITTEINVTTSKEYDLSTCENEIKSYIQKHLSTTETLKNATNLTHWDQYMINAFHKYCLDKTLLVNMDLTSHQLRLIGPADDVKRAIEKYRLLSEILKLKSSTRVPPPIEPRLSVEKKQIAEATSNRSYNIAFSYCQQDQSVCHHLLALLLGEGYQICQPSSNGSLSKSRIDRSDLLLVYFSDNYVQDAYRMADIQYAKSSGKTIVSVAETSKPLQDSEENSWLHSMTITGLFYDTFNHEIELEFTGDFDLEYDKILSVLLRYTRPGVTGQPYKEILPTVGTNPNDAEYEQSTFGHVSLALQKITITQRKEQEKMYKSQVKRRIEKEKIENDEMNQLIGSLILVVDDLEAILRGENVNKDMLSDEDKSKDYWERKSDEKYSQDCANDFRVCVKRWMEKAPNIIKKNIPPFTPTGDINDALFLVAPRTTHFWWLTQEDEHVENLPKRRDYFSVALWDSCCSLNSGFWFTDKQADDCWQQMIKADGRTNQIYTTIDENEIVWNMNTAGEAVDDDVMGDPSKIGDEIKNLEELRKLEELDDPNKLWKVKKRMRHHIMKQVQKFIENRRIPWKVSQEHLSGQQLVDRLIEEERQVAEKFLKKKLQNAAEFRKLCND